MWWLRASSPIRWSSRAWSSRAPCLALLSGTCARRAIHETGFEEIVHAEDLNWFKEFAHNASVVSVLAEAKKCQTELHKWCIANQVSFDPAKESAHIMSHAQPYGDPFKIARNLLRLQTPGWTWPYETWSVRLLGNWPRSWGPGASTASRNLCKFTNRRSFRLLSTAFLQCTTRPKQLWRCRGALSANAVSLTKRRSYISTSPHWRLDGTSLCWVWFIVRFSDVARGTLRTCFCPLRRRLPRYMTNNC